MPNRMLREKILDSDHYLNLPSDTARVLFLAFVLTADDLGNAEATDGAIRRRLLPATDHRPRLTPDECETLVGQLADEDLVRVYWVDAKRYVHIPRFRQRLRSYKRTNPRPPAEMECNEIKDLLANLPDNSLTDDGHMTDTRGRREEKGSEGKGREVKNKGPRATPGTAQPVDNSAPKKLNGKWWDTAATIDAKAKSLGIIIPAGQTRDDAYQRVKDEIDRRKTSPRAPRNR